MELNRGEAVIGDEVPVGTSTTTRENFGLKVEAEFTVRGSDILVDVDAGGGNDKA